MTAQTVPQSELLSGASRAGNDSTRDHLTSLPPRADIVTIGKQRVDRKQRVWRGR